jgi:predicted alpha/beta hydrolase family esterase
MDFLADTTVLFVPGLRDHVPEHWQTLLQAQIPNSRSVQPLEHDKLSRAARVAALDEALAEIDGPVVLVAHSAGVMITVHWAAQHHRKIRAALLAAPADLENPMPAGYPTTPRSTSTAGCRFRVAPCPSPALLAPAATIRWRASIAWSRWRATGAANWSISARSAI